MKKFWIILLSIIVVVAVGACMSDGSGTDINAESDESATIITQSENESSYIESATSNQDDTISETPSAKENTISSAIEPSTSKPSQSSSTTQEKEDVVYRTPKGKRYHLDPDCGGKNSYSVTISKAKKAGLTPCQKCAS